MSDTLKCFELDSISLAVPARFSDSGYYCFSPPGEKRDFTESISFTASHEPGFQDVHAFAQEILEKLTVFGQAVKYHRKEDVDFAGRAAYFLEYSLGDGGTFISRSLLIELGDKRYLGINYTTQDGPGDEQARWTTITKSVTLTGDASKRGDIPVGFKVVRLPEVLAFIPAKLQRRLLYTFSEPKGSQILVGVTLLAAPTLAGVIANQAEDPKAAARISRHEKSREEMPESPIELERFEVANEYFPEQRSQVIRTKRVFMPVGFILVEGHGNINDSSLFADTLILSRQARFQGAK